MLRMDPREALDAAYELEAEDEEPEEPRLPSVPGRRALTDDIVPLVRRDAASAAATVAPGAGTLLAVAARESGRPLPDEAAGRLENALATDLSQVRVHSGAASAAASRALGANAFAVGQDIHFAEGKYDPGSAEGERLLAHEVAHTAQQGGAAGSSARGRVARAQSDGRTYDQAWNPYYAFPNQLSDIEVETGTLGETAVQEPEVTRRDDAAEVEAERFAQSFTASGDSGRPSFQYPGQPGPSLRRTTREERLLQNRARQARRERAVLLPSQLPPDAEAWDAVLQVCSTLQRQLGEAFEGAFGLLRAAAENSGAGASGNAGVGGVEPTGGATQGGAMAQRAAALEDLVARAASGVVIGAARELAPFLGRLTGQDAGPPAGSTAGAAAPTAVDELAGGAPGESGAQTAGGSLVSLGKTLSVLSRERAETTRLLQLIMDKARGARGSEIPFDIFGNDFSTAAAGIMQRAAAGGISLAALREPTVPAAGAAPATAAMASPTPAVQLLTRPAVRGPEAARSTREARSAAAKGLGRPDAGAIVQCKTSSQPTGAAEGGARPGGEAAGSSAEGATEGDASDQEFAQALGRAKVLVQEIKRRKAANEIVQPWHDDIKELVACLNKLQRTQTFAGRFAKAKEIAKQRMNHSGMLASLCQAVSRVKPGLEQEIPAALAYANQAIDKAKAEDILKLTHRDGQNLRAGDYGGLFDTLRNHPQIIVAGTGLTMVEKAIEEAESGPLHGGFRSTAEESIAETIVHEALSHAFSYALGGKSILDMDAKHRLLSTALAILRGEPADVVTEGESSDSLHRWDLERWDARQGSTVDATTGSGTGVQRLPGT